jgi:long-chain acyl-CoA synthetase
VIPAAPADPPSDAELIEYCRARLAHVKCPRSVEVVDSLGRTPMGKVNKRELCRPYWADVEPSGPAR